MCSLTDLHPGNIICQRVVAAEEGAAEDRVSALLSQLGRLVKSVWSNQSVEDKDKDKEEDDASVKFRLVLIDAGLAASLDRTDRRNFIDLFHAVVTNDGARAGELMIERSASHSCVRPEQFKATMKQLVDDVHR